MIVFRFLGKVDSRGCFCGSGEKRIIPKRIKGKAWIEVKGYQKRGVVGPCHQTEKEAKHSLRCSTCWWEKRHSYQLKISGSNLRISLGTGKLWFLWLMDHGCREINPIRRPYWGRVLLKTELLQVPRSGNIHSSRNLNLERWFYNCIYKGRQSGSWLTERLYLGMCKEKDSLTLGDVQKQVSSTESYPHDIVKMSTIQTKRNNNKIYKGKCHLTYEQKHWNNMQSLISNFRSQEYMESQLLVIKFYVLQCYF